MEAQWELRIRPFDAMGVMLSNRWNRLSKYPSRLLSRFRHLMRCCVALRAHCCLGSSGLCLEIVEREFSVHLFVWLLELSRGLIFELQRG
jgi:hypothetical protein